MIQRRKKECRGCKEQKYLFSGGKCKGCWATEKYKKTKKRKPRRRIKRVSESYKETLKLYRPRRKEFLKARPMCEARLDVCIGKSEVIHHMRKKFSRERYLDERYWMATCAPCNNRIEEIGEEAYKRGLKIRG